MFEPPFALSGNAEAFDEADPYNPENRVKGYINRSGNSKYGALWITHVNDRERQQMIWATPKMHYPFNEKTGFYRPNKDSQIEVYEKYDGTNILAFSYKDADGKQFVSYKTRLRPFVGASKFGDFKRLWDEILAEYPEIPYHVKDQDLNLSFELFGKRNKILIDYDESLDTVLLFGVDVTGRVIPPTEIDDGTIPHANLIECFPAGDFEKEYARVREELNKKLIVVKVDVDGEEKIESMSGMEGAILYIIDPGAELYVSQYKAKPDAVQDIHWAASKGIPYHSIYTTIINAFEETDSPDADMIKKLLLEEFTEQQIERRHVAIIKMLESVRFEKKMKVELREEYLKMGFDIVADKTTCMRHFGKIYDKGISGKVFRYLMEEFGGKINGKN
jgi:hypothetical protein